MTVRDFYRTIDPKYGVEPHQRAFLERMDRAQLANPCTKTHDDPEKLASGRPAPRCHRTSCYPVRGGKMVGA